MYWQPALFGLACIGAIAAATKTACYPATLLAWMMASVCAGANLLWLSDQTEYMPLLDLPVAVMGYAFWFDSRIKWQAWFTSAMFSRLLLHLVYPGSHAFGEVGYFHVLNAMFFVALAAIAWKGGADAIGVCLRSLHRLRCSLASDSRYLASEMKGVG